MKQTTEEFNLGVSSIPDEAIGFFFNLLNPFSRTITLGLTQPLSEMSTRRYLTVLYLRPTFWEHL
jgi:hypothetical protein